MKKLFVVILIFSGLYAQAQIPTGTYTPDLKYRIGITGTALSAPRISSKGNLVGLASHDVYKPFSMGISGIYKLNPLFSVETGLDFIKFRYSTQNASLGPDGRNFEDQDFRAISIPLLARVNFLKSFYANLGPMLTVQLSDSEYLDPQGGLGAMAGVGIERQFSQLTFVTGAYIKSYKLFPAEGIDFVLEPGLKIGAYLGF